MMCPASPASNVGSLSPTTGLLPRLVPLDCLTPLIDALSAQTEAINRLAQSNEALVKAMIESEGQDDAEDTGGYTSLGQRAR